MPHLMSHGSSDPRCIVRVVLLRDRQTKLKLSTRGYKNWNNALGEFTELTPPDWYSEHMALRGARPMMAP